MARLNLKIVASVGGAIAVACAPFTVNWEGWRTQTYIDIAGIKTVCGGHTDRAGTQAITKTTYTDDECSAITAKDVAQANRQLRAVIGSTPLTMNQEVAFTDFVFALGIGAFMKSSMPALIKSGRIPAACAVLPIYNKARVNGVLQPIQGLSNRRNAEYQLCMKPSTEFTK